MKPERNDPCPCGSGKKYKKCCGTSVANTPVTLRSQALAAFKRGNFTASIAYCRQLLQVAPSDFDAYHLLGLSELQSGRLASAVTSLTKAVQLEPRNPFALNNLAFAHHRLGEFAEAERCARSALALDSKLSDAHNNLGLALAILGRTDEAVAAYREATLLAPENALFRCNLARALFQRGELESAEHEYQRTLEMAPQFAAALAGLGTASLLRKNWVEARTLLEQAIAAGEREAMVFNNLGIALRSLNELTAARDAFEQALKREPGFGGAHYNLGLLFEKLGDPKTAIAAYTQALKHGFSSPDVWLSLISTFGQVCDFRARTLAWQRFDALFSQGCLQDDTLGLALLHSDYADCLSEETVLHYHRAWGDRQERRMSAKQITYQPGIPTPGKKIKLGYLSPDFREHSVGHFIRHVLANHDREVFEVVCYALSNSSDAVTEQIRAQVDQFHNVTQLDDEALARKIRADGIHCLIDLAGHTANNRLPVLALKPAPLQCTWIGYLHTTGLKAVDYRITDPYADDPTQDSGPERLLVLPESFLCFGDFPECPIDPTLAVTRNGFVTFASFNNLAKITAEAVRIWAKLLARVPTARFQVMATGASSETVRNNLLAEFAQHGIAPERIHLKDFVPRQDYLRAHNDVDIILDTWPFNGGTVTAGALWMGVPVVTLVGKPHRQRVGYSMLKNIGIQETIAWSDDEYVGIATHLAQDPARLAGLREKIATGIRASILCDPPRFTRQLEAALRRAWEEYLDSPHQGKDNNNG